MSSFLENLASAGEIVSALSGAVAAIAAMITVRQANEQARQNRKRETEKEWEEQEHELVYLDTYLRPVMDSLLRFQADITKLHFNVESNSADVVDKAHRGGEAFSKHARELEWSIPPSPSMGADFIIRWRALKDMVSELSGAFGRTWAHKPAFVEAFGIGGPEQERTARTLSVISAALEEIAGKAGRLVSRRAPDAHKDLKSAPQSPVLNSHGKPKSIDLDPTGATLAWWRARMDDAIRVSIYVMGGIAAVAGIALSALLGGDLTPIQVYYADAVLSLSTMLVFVGGYGLLILYLFKIADVVNVFTPNRPSDPPKVQFRKAISSGGLWCFVLMGLGVTIGLPTFLGVQIRRELPEFHKLLRCEVEVLKSLEVTGFVPEFDCSDTLSEMRSPVRILPRIRSAPDTFGE